MGAKVGVGCERWRWVRGMPLDMICGVGQGGGMFCELPNGEM
jgi:hypothetical protein